MSNKPAYRIYQIEEPSKKRKEAGAKNRWREIGALWANKDGSLQIDLAVVPLVGIHDIQARPYEEAPKGDE